MAAQADEKTAPRLRLSRPGTTLLLIAAAVVAIEALFLAAWMGRRGGAEPRRLRVAVGAAQYRDYRRLAGARPAFSFESPLAYRWSGIRSSDLRPGEVVYAALHLDAGGIHAPFGYDNSLTRLRSEAARRLGQSYDDLAASGALAIIRGKKADGRDAFDFGLDAEAIAAAGQRPPPGAVAVMTVGREMDPILVGFEANGKPLTK